jgi:hypothetical protein
VELLQFGVRRADGQTPGRDKLEDVTGIHPRAQDTGAIAGKFFLKSAVLVSREIMVGKFISQLLVRHPPVQGFLELVGLSGVHGSRYAEQHI